MLRLLLRRFRMLQQLSSRCSASLIVELGAFRLRVASRPSYARAGGAIDREDPFRRTQNITAGGRVLPSAVDRHLPNL